MVVQIFKSRKFLLSYMEIAKLGMKGQIVIPQKIRAELSIDTGSILAIEKVKDLVVIKKVDNDLENQFKKSLDSVKLGRIKRVA